MGIGEWATGNEETTMTHADVLELNRRQPRRLFDNGMIAPAQTPITPDTGAASLLAYLGAAPLIVAALVAIASPAEDGARATGFMALYGAALLIFFGGVRWGVAVMKPKGPSMRSLVGAAIPMLAAMPILAFSIEGELKLMVLMAMMIALLVDDLKATGRGEGAPQWYLGVRAPLTALIEVAFLVALAAGMGR
jgi:hypothetical protein